MPRPTPLRTAIPFPRTLPRCAHRQCAQWAAAVAQQEWMARHFADVPLMVRDAGLLARRYRIEAVGVHRREERGWWVR